MSLKAETDFGLSLLKETDVTQSVVISPLSIALALALVHSGAGGKSKDEILKVIAEGATDKDLQEHYSNISDALLQKSKVIVKLANRIFIKTQFHVEPNGDRTDIILGEFDEAVHKAWVDENPEARRPKKFENRINRISHIYVKGDFCHETKAHRSVEMRLRCKKVEGSPLTVLMDLKEPTTCQYILVLESERFCEPIQYADNYGLIALEPASTANDEEPANRRT